MKKYVLMEWNIRWRLNRHSVTVPIHRQIMLLIRKEYDRKNFPDAFRMPSIRKLALFLKVNRYQVEKAYSCLIISNEILYNKKGIGTFMTNDLPEGGVEHLKSRQVLSGLSFSAQQQTATSAEQSKCLNILTLGYPYQMHAYNTFDKLRAGSFYKQCKKTKYSGQYLLPQAYRVLKRRNVIDDDRQLCLIPKGKALYEILDNLLHSGAYVASIFPEDKPVNEIFSRLGLNSVFVDADAEGMIAPSLEQICKNYPIKAIVIRTSSDFAALVCLTIKRWEQLLKLAEEYKFWILVLDDDYEFSGFRLPKRNTLQHCSFLIYISLLNKICYFLQEVSLVTGPIDFINALSKNVTKHFANWNHVLEKSIVALYTSLEMKADIKRIRNKCRHGAYILRRIFDNYFQKGAELFLPKAGAFALVFFKPAISAQHLKSLSSSEIFHPEENIGFKKDQYLDGIRISLCMKNWKVLEHIFKCLSTV